MPELPEVETIARDLRPLVVGRRVVSAWTDWPRVVRYPSAAHFLESVLGRRLTAVGRRAKWVLLDLDGDLVLPVQVKMTGQLDVVPADRPRDRHVHLALGLDGGEELRLRDVRKFARVGLYRRDAEGRLLGADDAGDLFGGHGPEPLEASFDLAAFRRRLHARRGRLKSLLLDQAFVAGIGNIYADEILWTARLHPLRSADTLRPADERRLYEAIRAILGEAVERRGSSVDTYTAPGGDGQMQEHLRVYQRTGQACVRCGRPVRRIVVGGRATHFCSWCQRRPRGTGRERARRGTDRSARQAIAERARPSG